jgi:benzil reductase ((S)-benzoin forming)
MDIAIVTGSSRGLGYGLASQLVERGFAVYGLARSSPSPPIVGGESGGTYHHVFADLSQTESATARLAEVLDRAKEHADARIVLINNAGQLSPVRPLERVSGQEAHGHLMVNVEAVAAFMSLFLSTTASWSVSRHIVNISSGAATKPYPGWSLYCASKAATDMLARVSAAEQEGSENAARVIAVAPGVVDTEMQSTIRRTSAEDFPKRERFVQLHQQGKLDTAEHAAAQVLRALEDPEVESGEVVDVRTRYG